MSSILLRIFFLYNLINSFIIYLIPKKLQSFLLRQINLIHNKSQPPAASPAKPRAPAPVSDRPTKRDSTELNKVFQMFDQNKDGRITKKELNESLQNLGIFVWSKDLTEMFEKIDSNGDGCVDMDEFGALYESVIEDDEDTRDAFNVFDENGDGFISVDELRSVMDSLGLKQGRCLEECKRMMMKVDVNGDGLVDYREFKQMMKMGQISALT